jgi:hypothetical protein
MGRGSEAAALGAQLGLTDLETLGIAIEGAALLAQGRVDQGMRRLDQAAAVAAGEDFELPTLAWVGAVHHDRGLRTLGDFGAWLSGAKRCGRSAPTETSSPAGASGLPPRASCSRLSQTWRHIRPGMAPDGLARLK